MAKRRKRYGDVLTETQAREEALYRSRVLKDAERSFHEALRVGYCTRALSDLTFASRQVAVFGLTKAVAQSSYRSGRARRYDFPMKKLRTMEAKFKAACLGRK